MEVALGVPCASIGPSVASLYHAPLKLKGALAVAISQSGQSPDVVEMQRAARRGGALTVALVNEVESPLASEAEVLAPLWAGAFGGGDQVDDCGPRRRREPDRRLERYPIDLSHIEEETAQAQGCSDSPGARRSVGRGWSFLSMDSAISMS